jgi:hypothetical protein
LRGFACVCVLRDEGELVDEFSSPADLDGLHHVHKS